MQRANSPASMSPVRIVLVLVTVLWLVTGALLAWVKSAAPPPGPETRTILRVFAEKPALAGAMRKAFDKHQLPVSALADQAWKREVTEGFRAILMQSDEELRKALFTGMKNGGLAVSLKGEEIQLGGVYKTQAEAQKAQKAATAKGFSFEIVDNRVMKTSKTVLLKVGPLTSEQRTQAETVIEQLKLKPEQVESEEVLFTPSPAETP